MGSASCVLEANDAAVLLVPGEAEGERRQGPRVLAGRVAVLVIACAQRLGVECQGGAGVGADGGDHRDQLLVAEVRSSKLVSHR
jgi:hypothetical protein